MILNLHNNILFKNIQFSTTNKLNILIIYILFYVLATILTLTFNYTILFLIIYKINKKQFGYLIIIYII